MKQAIKYSMILNEFISFLDGKLLNACEYFTYVIEVKQGSTADDMLKNIICFNQIVNRYNMYHITYKLNLLTSRKELRFDKRRG